MEIKTLFEDNHIIVVIKDQNVPVCEDESKDADLLNAVRGYLGRPFVGLVHRLDRVTGGVMVFAKTSKAASRLGEQLQDGSFKKKYLAVVVGEPKQREGRLVDHLLKNEEKNIVTIVPRATTGAKRAELNYRAIDIKKQVSLVEIELLTGRSHQIRVQMGNIGCPVFGDAKYGGDKLGKGWNTALWAHELSFKHPITDDVLKFVVNPPEDVPWDRFEFDRKVKKEGRV
jgi:23S rRNA pseudouridine1911/1915/1917 synthase